jgi:hypothetical protein
MDAKFAPIVVNIKPYRVMELYINFANAELTHKNNYKMKFLKTIKTEWDATDKIGCLACIIIATLAITLLVAIIIMTIKLI